MKLIRSKDDLITVRNSFRFFSSKEFNAETHTKCREVENLEFNFAPVHIKCPCSYHQSCVYG